MEDTVGVSGWRSEDQIQNLRCYLLRQDTYLVVELCLAYRYVPYPKLSVCLCKQNLHSARPEGGQLHGEVLLLQELHLEMGERAPQYPPGQVLHRPMGQMLSYSSCKISLINTCLSANHIVFLKFREIKISEKCPDIHHMDFNKFI